MSASAWSTQQLAEFLAALSTAGTEAAAALATVERTAEELDAEIAAIVCGDQLVAAVGYPDSAVPVGQLATVAPGVEGRLAVPGLGVCPATAVQLEHPPGARLVVARCGTGLGPQEASLLRGIAHASSITMRMLHLFDEERAARRDSAQRQRQLEQLASEQAALRRVATLVAGGASPSQTWSAVAAEVGQLLGADVTMVLRYEPDGTGTVIGGWGGPGVTVPQGRGLTIDGVGVAVLVLRSGRPARTEQFEGPPGSLPALVRQLGVQSGLGAPITVEGRLWGVVIAASMQAQQLPAGSELRIAKFTELLGTALANAQARVELRRIADEQAALRRVATLVARGEPPAAVFAAVAEEVGQVLAAADFTMVGRYDPDGAVEVVGAWCKAGNHQLVGRRACLGGRNVSTLVFERKEPGRVDYLADDASALAVAAGELGMRSSVGAPISVEGRLWGVMIVASTHEDTLPTGTEHRLADFIELVATAIANAQAREELRTLADEQATLRRVATLVACGEPPGTVFAAVAEEVGQLLPAADYTLVGRYDPDRALDVVGSWSRTGDHPIPLGRRVSLNGQTVTALVFDTGRPARRDSYADAPGVITAEARVRGVGSAVGVPISVEGRVWGVVMVASTREGPLPPDTEDRLVAFTELVAAAIANAEAHAQLTASRARIVTTADQTRRRIERDLHDGAQQRLVSLALRLRAARAAVPPALDQLAGELDRVAAGLTSTLGELREITRGIHPAILVEGGLAAALKTLARRSPVPVRLDVRTQVRMPERVEVTAYYVVSEGLTNAAKHANAATVHISVDLVDGEHQRLRLSVSDDGIGGADPTCGSGLVGLKDRVEAIGGTLRLRSRPGEGTRLDLELPLDW